MKKLTIAAMAGISALATASPALAQDSEAPFSGFYVGGAVGYDAQPNDFQERVLFDKNLDGVFGDSVVTAAGANAFSPGFCNGQAITNAPAGGCRNDRDDWSYYGRVGFDLPVGGDIYGGGIVLGVVGEIGKSEIADSVSAFSTTPASYTLRREINFDAGLRARAGYVRNTTMFYATGGLKYARVENSLLTTNRLNAYSSGIEQAVKSDAWGYSAGGGLEQKLGRNFSVGIEYLFNRVKDDDFRVRVTQGTAAATNPFVLAPNTTGTDLRRSVDNFTWHSGRVTAAFRF